jgi:hypothetical protein
MLTGVYDIERSLLQSSFLVVRSQFSGRGIFQSFEEVSSNRKMKSGIDDDKRQKN